jgi:hypothetical protein
VAAAPPPALKWLLRAPVALYGVRGGWLLGHRFLLLAHRGRRSGRVHRTVLEVVSWSASTREAVVVSGFGHSAQWYRNVLAGFRYDGSERARLKLAQTLPLVAFSPAA